MPAMLADVRISTQAAIWSMWPFEHAVSARMAIETDFIGFLHNVNRHHRTSLK